MTTFPFLCLPDLVFHQIYDVLEVPEIILLSQCSKRLKSMLKSCATPSKAPELQVSVHQHTAHISVTRARKCFTWTLGYRLGKFEKLVINKTLWMVMENNDSQSSRGWLSTPKSAAFEKQILELVRLFRGLFNCPIHSIHFGFGKFLSFDKLLVETDDLHRATSISVGFSTLEKREMDFMFDHFVAKNLSISCLPDENYFYSGTLNFEKIEVSCAMWICPKMMEKMTETCKQLSLKSAILITDTDINQFIKNWLAGENITLETVKITREPFHYLWSFYIQDFAEPFDAEKILEGIPHVPGAKKRPDAAKYIEGNYKYENGVDIQRSSDGLMATILIVNSSREFVFTVWYDEEPNLLSCS